MGVDDRRGPGGGIGRDRVGGVGIWQFRCGGIVMGRDSENLSGRGKAGYLQGSGCGMSGRGSDSGEGGVVGRRGW